MPQLVSYVGDAVDLDIPKGAEFTNAHVLYDADGAAITTVSAARVVFKTGTTENVGSAVSGLTITPTVAAGTTITWTMTDTQTGLAAFVVGSEYCWFMEAEYTDGTIQEIYRGNVRIFAEGA